MVEILRVKNEDEMRLAREIWMSVFAAEPGFSAGLDTDESDAGAIHVLCCVDKAPAGCAGILFYGGEAQIGKVAVLKNMRRNGIGTGMCKLLITLALEQGVSRIITYALLPAEEFYNTLGFQKEGEPLREAGNLYVKMVKKL
jgi:GNAT superfamily N-acetyltransferase